jgi:hypothetical protein
MGSITRHVRSVVRKLASLAADLLPGPPSDDATPPDIDGRRSPDADQARRKVDLEAKAGKGGYR